MPPAPMPPAPPARLCMLRDLLAEEPAKQKRIYRQTVSIRQVSGAPIDANLYCQRGAVQEPICCLRAVAQWMVKVRGVWWYRRYYYRPWLCLVQTFYGHLCCWVEWHFDQRSWGHTFDKGSYAKCKRVRFVRWFGLDYFPKLSNYNGIWINNLNKHANGHIMWKKCRDNYGYMLAWL